MTPTAVLAIFVGLAASLEDLLARRISNWIPLTALIGGIGCHGLNSGWQGIGTSLLGAATGFAVFLVFYLRGGMGGGDIKLMAGFGALLGVRQLLEAALWTGACGGILATVWTGIYALRGKRKGAERSGPPEDSIPYAPAIAAGAWLALL
jgi:Flp pilus assembly protein, protease CpaA